MSAELTSASTATDARTTLPATDPSSQVRPRLRFGARVTGYYFDTDFLVSVDRNAARSGRALVPLVGLVDTAHRLQPPTLDEGFDELWLVRAVDGRFDVEPFRSGRGG